MTTKLYPECVYDMTPEEVDEETDACCEKIHEACKVRICVCVFVLVDSLVIGSWWMEDKIGFGRQS